ncbi:alpha/beta-hydrolase [Phlebopus sp. FC_14]|nr:alpha/beta-hydrolase [Phlebopus sp. FC_14]
MFEFRFQPLKTVYFLYFISSILFVRLPYWVISSLIPAWRPRTSWTLFRTLNVNALRSMIDAFYATGSFPADDPEKSAQSADKLGFVWIDPLPAALLTGEIASAARANNVVSTRTHGYWYGKDVGSGAHGQKASPNEKVLYFLHGGAFIMGTACPANPSGHGPAIVDLMKHCSAIFDRAFCLDYRLASSAPLKVANPFPAAIIDAVAGYRYLVENLGFQARNIIVCGDSAGGQLAFCLIRYLAQEALPSLPPPGTAVLVSPPGGCTHDYSPTSSMTVNARSDFVKTIFHCGFTARSLLGSLPPEEIETNTWLSPSSPRIDTTGLFSNFPPTCIIVGGAEQALDSMKTLHHRLVADNDPKQITYWEYPDAAHAFLMTNFQEPEKTEASKALAQWICEIYGGGEVKGNN